MIDQRRIKEAQQNVRSYLREGLLKEERSETAQLMFLKNADLSLAVARKLLDDPLKPSLWVIVCSYYSMFYMANTVLLHLGHRVGGKIAHKVTSDALVVYTLDKLKKQLLEEYEEVREQAMEIASNRAESLLENYEHERRKRSYFQYEMAEEVKEQKAKTSFERAKEFVFEMRKLLDG